MRVLFPFVGDNVGGSHICAIRLVKAFAGTSIEPLVVLHEPGQLDPYLEDQKVPYAFLPNPRYVLAHRPRDVYRQFVAIAPRLAMFIRRHRVDIVHTNDQRMYWTWLVPTLLARRRFLLHLRYMPTSEHPTHRKLVRLAHGIVCDSEEVLKALKAELRPRTKVIRSAIDWERAAPNRAASRSDLLDRLECSRDAVIVGYFSNFMERKRPLTFVEVAARIARSFPRPVVFVMYGNDRQDFANAIRKLAAERGIADLVHIMGFASAAEEAMAGCDLMIAPALREPLGLTLLEGCFAGTPVLAANDAGHREIYGKVVPELLVEPDDLDGFARSTLSLLGDSHGTQALMHRARAALSRQFSMVSYAKAIEDVYRELVS